MRSKPRRRSAGGSKMSEVREDVDGQLQERRSTLSSGVDSPSLSGSLPSVADSHCSHLSELSGPGPEPDNPSARGPSVSPLPEVEHDRLERCPPQDPLLLPASPRRHPVAPRGTAKESASSLTTRMT